MLKAIVMEHLLENMFAHTPLFVSFIAGVLTFLSPCVLPLIPAYLSYICGENLQYIKEKKRSFSLFFQALVFVLGFGLVFVIFGASSAKIISVFAPTWLKQLAGIIVILFGLHFLHIFRFSFLYKSKQIQLDTQSHFKRFFSPFILGLSFGLGWTPCIGPIFTSIIILSSTQEDLGILLMITYAIGIGVPFLLVALFIQQSFDFFNKIKKHFRIIEIISGTLLIILGVLIASGWIDQIANWML